MALTRRQKEVLDFIAHFVQDNQYSPSYEEIATGLDLASLATVHKHIQALETKRYLKRGFNQSRSIELAEKYFQEQKQFAERAPAMMRPVAVMPSVPLLGRIAAGAPVEAVAGNATLEFGDFAANTDTYALEVRGDSMIDDHIMSGDFVLIKRTREVRDGDIVVALVGGTESTLKRFYREPDGRARLQPANSTMGPILVPMDQLEIQGKLLAVLRKYGR
jgi:repressor LexA